VATVSAASDRIGGGWLVAENVAMVTETASGSGVGGAWLPKTSP